jgi:hypothetical protein
MNLNRFPWWGFIGVAMYAFVAAELFRQALRNRRQRRRH